MFIIVKIVMNFYIEDSFDKYHIMHMFNDIILPR